MSRDPGRGPDARKGIGTTVTNPPGTTPPVSTPLVSTPLVSTPLVTTPLVSNPLIGLETPSRPAAPQPNPLSPKWASARFLCLLGPGFSAPLLWGGFF
ncbi:MAG: hypothetical protein LBP95_02470 [Deltaproteobacteria bacterium]|jgi:hypothetical protein|nr:hypothetical protein [Deltaproteobacteria bacterium]